MCVRKCFARRNSSLGATAVEATLVLPFLGLIIFGFSSLALGLIKIFVAQQAAYGAVVMGGDLKAGAEPLMEARASSTLALIPKFLRDAHSSEIVHGQINDTTTERTVSLAVRAPLQNLIPLIGEAVVGGKLVGPMLSTRETVDPNMAAFANPGVLYSCGDVGDASGRQLNCGSDDDDRPLICRNSRGFCIPTIEE